MTTVLIAPDLESTTAGLVINLPDSVNMSDDDFFEFCQLNRDLRIERTAEGEIIVMSPTGAKTGSRSSEINMQLRVWANGDGSGVAFDSSTGFKLPNGAERSPDAAWILRSRLAILTEDQKEKFLPLCPNFVIELRSPSDRLSQLQAKMKEYIENGADLGWLIDPLTKRVHIYRPDRSPEILDAPDEPTAGSILPGFVLTMAEIWDPAI